MVLIGSDVEALGTGGWLVALLVYDLCEMYWK